MHVLPSIRQSVIFDKTDFQKWFLDMYQNYQICF